MSRQRRQHDSISLKETASAIGGTDGRGNIVLQREGRGWNSLEEYHSFCKQAADRPWIGAVSHPGRVLEVSVRKCGCLEEFSPQFPALQGA